MTASADLIYRIEKRALDLLICFLLLPPLLPVFGVIAIVIKITSPGAILYRGLRMGKEGRKFYIFKFRTMVVDAEKRGGGTTALDDPRIFCFGGFLRRFKLDELPQLFNVLLGEMSLVGPRPELPNYTDQYNAAERAILSVLPGITDYSSVRFSSLDEVVGAHDADRVFENIVLPEKNRLRLQYVQNQSMSEDIKILWLTGRCLVRKCFGRVL